MISSASLIEWLSDPSRQIRSDAYRSAVAERWLHHPLMIDLREELEGADNGSASSLLAVAERFMDRRPEISELVEQLIAGAAHDPFFRPPQFGAASDIHAGLMLYNDTHLTLSVGVMSVDALAAKKSVKTGPKSIGFIGMYTLFDFIKSGGATLSFWEAPAATADFAGTQKCRLLEKRRIEDGERVFFDGRSQSFVVEHATSDLVYVQAVISAEAAPVTAEYDSDSLAFVGASSTDEVSSRTQMMLTLLRMMDRKDAVPLFEQNLESPHFYTRWHVMREFLALDSDAALPSLRRMAAGDSHPDVRVAAQQTLDMFFADAEEEKLRCRA